MRNHNEKTRDMARSVLPSNARTGSRETRANIHGRERAHERLLMHALRGYVDPNDFDGDLGVAARHLRDVEEMVNDRRSADKTGPLIAWAERLVERDPALSAATAEDREVYFRKVLPPGLIGNHAISHLSRVLYDRPRFRRWRPTRSRNEAALAADVAAVAAIIAAGRHGDLNRRLRSRLDRVERRTVRLPAERLIDADHPAPGLLLPRRSVTEFRRRNIRFLAGPHDARDFVANADRETLEIMRALHVEVTMKPVPSNGASDSRANNPVGVHTSQH